MKTSNTVSFLASFTDSTLTLIVLPCLLAPITLVPNLKSIPCFERIFWNVFATSKSMPTPKSKRIMKYKYNKEQQKNMYIYIYINLR